MSKNEKRLEELKVKAQADYSAYKTDLENVIKRYEDERDKYNAQLAMINSERLSMREELNKLHAFLLAIGGSLDKKITTFEFATEAYAPNLGKVQLNPVESPFLKDDFGFFNFTVQGVKNSMGNKSKIENYAYAMEQRKLEYDKDIKRWETQIKYMGDAALVAELYRHIVVVVRDAVREKIIPEMSFIQAFLYADAIREQIVERGVIEEIIPCDIVEYRGTKYDTHYCFIRNTFDFYDLCKNLFNKTILTDILADNVISEKEKWDFEAATREIKSQINVLDGMRVLKEE